MASGDQELAAPDLPRPPFIDVDGIFNFRDIGGYPVTTSAAAASSPASSSSSPATSLLQEAKGAAAAATAAISQQLAAATSTSTSTARSVRRGFVFRSAEPSGVTPAGITTLTTQLGVRKIFDLRSAPEIDKQLAQRPMQDVPGAERVFAPVVREADYSPEALAGRYREYASGGPAGFSSAYHDILTHAPAAYTAVLEHVRDHPDQPLLIHCSAGKDRTGVLVALLLELAGARPDLIAREYNLTELGLVPLRHLFLPRLVALLGGDTHKAENMGSARHENMLATLDMIRDRFGGAEGYLKTKCGFMGEDIRTIRANLLSSDPPILK